jgi:hypothetical protein
MRRPRVPNKPKLQDETLYPQPGSALTSELHAHPRNYRKHPDDQLEHIVESIRAHGFYRNIVVARDGTILAGHGVVEAARKMGVERVPVVKLDVDPEDPRALKVLAGDNEISRLGEIDDRALSQLLKEISTDVDGLLGTGYDEMMLANLVFVTRPSSEIESLDAAAEWAGAGMPEYEDGKGFYRVMVLFTTEQERLDFVKMIGAENATKSIKGMHWTYRWPLRESTDDWGSVKFDAEET